MALSGWPADQKIPIIIPATGAALTDFPILVKISATAGTNSDDLTAVFDELGSSSLKIAVEDGDTGNQCYVEVERWDDANELAWLHVKVPLTAAAATTTLYLYYDAAHADNTTYVGAIGSAPGQAVWDDNFVAVWHMASYAASDVPVDSTGNAFDGTPANMDSSNLVDGAVGKGYTLNGSDERIVNIPDHADFDIDTLTLEAIITDPDDGDVAHTLLHHGDTSVGGNQGQAYMVRNGTIRVSYFNGVWRAVAAVESLPAGSNHIAWAMDASYFRPYYDGEAQTPVSLPAALGDTTYVSTIGATKASTSYSNHWSGPLDEVRYSKVTRSAEWLAATALSLKDALVTISAP